MLYATSEDATESLLLSAKELVLFVLQSSVHYGVAPADLIVDLTLDAPKAALLLLAWYEAAHSRLLLMATHHTSEHTTIVR